VNEGRKKKEDEERLRKEGSEGTGKSVGSKTGMRKSGGKKACRTPPHKMQTMQNHSKEAREEKTTAP
jgi:hypothetical protein